ncbi:MAG TPA: TRAM domain-containing protein [Candidatus Korarchaeota archaeon]|nr:TRAM domain-containing protein [Candidatus Korarchaeota archaeon]
MPRKNPKGGSTAQSGWKGRLGRKRRIDIYAPRAGATQFGRESPLKVGDVIELLITDVTRRGEGVGQYRGRTVIVRGAADPGEVVTAVVKKITREGVFAEVA